MKTFLFIISRPIYKGAQTHEVFDQLMIVGAFEQQVSVLFTDDAVFQLSRDQQPEAIESNNIGKLIQALPIYEINTVFVESESLTERGLTVDNLIIPVQTIQRSQLSALLNQYQQVVNC